MISIAILLFSVAFVVFATIYQPGLFGENKFLEAFVTFEILNILAVIVTVTLASVAHIHITLNRIFKKLFRNTPNGIKKIQSVRKEINQNAWFLMLLFGACCLLLFVKGACEYIWIKSLTNGLASVILLANILVLYDIHSTIYKCVQLEEKIPD